MPPLWTRANNEQRYEFELMSADFDAIVTGAGHNGLTATGHLGKVGLRSLVLERRNGVKRVVRVLRWGV